MICLERINLKFATVFFMGCHVNKNEDNHLTEMIQDATPTGSKHLCMLMSQMTCLYSISIFNYIFISQNDLW